jgi:CRP/FNR family transcriptional regulator
MLNPSEIISLREILTFWKNLDETDLRLIMSTGSKSSYKQGEIILSHEKECSGLVAAKSGQIRAYFVLEDGREITLYRLLPGDICILTASCVIKNITFEITLEVEKDSEVYFIPALAWKKLTEKNIKVKDFSMALISERFSEVMWVIEQMLSKNIGHRIAALLLEYSVLEGSRTLNLTHDTIAKHLGTAREVISRSLKYLENDGVLKRSRGQIHLTDMEKLRQMSS